MQHQQRSNLDLQKSGTSGLDAGIPSIKNDQKNLHKQLLKANMSANKLQKIFKHKWKSTFIIHYMKHFVAS